MHFHFDRCDENKKTNCGLFYHIRRFVRTWKLDYVQNKDFSRRRLKRERKRVQGRERESRERITQNDAAYLA